VVTVFRNLLTSADSTGAREAPDEKGRLPDASIAQTMLWIWVGHRGRRSRVLRALAPMAGEAHPPPKPEQKLAYSQSLSKRHGGLLAGTAKAKTKRGPPDVWWPARAVEGCSGLKHSAL
jgi:hypothetical protein